MRGLAWSTVGLVANFITVLVAGTLAGDVPAGAAPTEVAAFAIASELAAASTSSLESAPSLVGRGVTAGAVHPLALLSVDDTRLAISALGRDWEIVLEPRSPLSDTARAELGDVTLPDFFGGHVIGDERSWVRLARDDERLSGQLFADGTLYRIVPPRVAGGAQGHRLVRVGKGALPGVASTRAVDPRPFVSRAMRVGIVVDSRYDEHHDGQGLARALTIMNGVDGLYREQLGLTVVVERVRVLDEPAGDPMRDENGTIEAVLTAFRDVRLGDPGLPADLALVHLFSGHETVDDVIGLGWIDTVCRVDGYDVSMSTPFVFDTLLSAHEIAHNLGALHDEDTRCDTDDTGGGTSAHGLMEERLSEDTGTGFSACSLERLQRALGADCLADSLDLALDVNLEAGVDPGSWRVNVSVGNADPFRTARTVRTRTRFPPGGRIEETSAGCEVLDELIVCEHGDLAPATTDTITVLAHAPAAGGDTALVAVIDAGEFVDSDPGNDRVMLDLVTVDERPANAPAVREPMADAAVATGGGAGDEGGGGHPGAPLLLALIASLAGRRRSRRACRIECYRSRSTEYTATLSSASR